MGLRSGKARGNPSKLEMEDSTCNNPCVLVRMKAFLQILMAILALGLPSPQPACAAANSPSAGASPCAECACCKLPHGQPCQQSYTATQVQTLDKLLPSRTSLEKHSGAYFLFSIASVKIKYPVLASVVQRRSLNASPPFGGGPPQAVLRLWRI